MAESSPRVAITVALIGVAGVIGAALIANWEKVVGPSQVHPSTPDRGPSAGVEPPPPEVRPNLNISGTWVDTNLPGTTSQFTQNGESFRFTRRGMLQNGVGFEASGSGTMSGLLTQAIMGQNIKRAKRRRGTVLARCRQAGHAWT